MSATHICILIIGLFTITEQRNQQTNDIDEILNYLSSQKGSQNQHNILRQPHQGINQQRYGEDERTFNLFRKQNIRNEQQEEEDLENALRRERDRICRSTGRCGCSGPRCGKSVDQDTAESVDQMLDDIGKELHRNQEELRLDNEETLKATLNNDDNLDLAVLAVSNSDTLKDKSVDFNDVDVIDLRNYNLEDLVNNRVDHILKSKKTALKRRIKKKPGKSLNMFNDNKAVITDEEADRDHISPEDLASYYVDGKAQVVNALLNYVKGKKGGDIYLSILQPSQKKEIQLLKNKRLTNKSLKSRIINVLFGIYSKSKILPHNEHNINVYVPKPMYEEILQYTKNKKLRAKKSVFPQTTQQKNRLLYNVTKIIPKIYDWRRNMGDDLEAAPKYGVPFKLIADGLGQFK